VCGMCVQKVLKVCVCVWGGGWGCGSAAMWGGGGKGWQAVSQTVGVVVVSSGEGTCE